MSTKKSAPVTPYLADRQYLAVLNAAIDLGHGMLLRPGEPLTLSGALLNDHADKVNDAQLVD